MAVIFAQTEVADLINFFWKLIFCRALVTAAFEKLRSVGQGEESDWACALLSQRLRLCSEHEIFANTAALRRFGDDERAYLAERG